MRVRLAIGGNRRLALALLGGVLAALAIITLLPWLGPYSPAADAFSHFRLHYVVMCAVVAALCLLVSRRIAIVAVSMAMVNFAGAAIHPRAASTPDARGIPLKIVTINTLYRVDNTDAVVALVRREAPDIVFLQEMTRAKAGIMTRLKADYPWQVHCIGATNCDTAILSRRPWREAGGRRLGRRGGSVAWARFGQDLAGLTVASVHLRWPLVSDQLGQLREVKDVLGSVAGPVVVAGDLNATAWSGVVRVFSAETGMRPAGGFVPTWPARGFKSGRTCPLCFPQLQIDHVLVSRGVEVVATRPGADVSSDHLPLFAEIVLDPASR